MTDLQNALGVIDFLATTFALASIEVRASVETGSRLGNQLQIHLATLSSLGKNHNWRPSENFGTSLSTTGNSNHCLCENQLADIDQWILSDQPNLNAMMTITHLVNGYHIIIFGRSWRTDRDDAPPIGPGFRGNNPRSLVPPIKGGARTMSVKPYAFSSTLFAARVS